MNGYTFSIKIPKEFSKKFAASLRRKPLSRGKVLRVFFLSLEDLGVPLLSGPVLRDTARLSQRYPPIARALWGSRCLNMANWVRYPPRPFSERFPLGGMRSGGAITPPLKRGISATLARYPMKTRQTGAIPPSAILSRKGIARYGGVSRTGPLSASIDKVLPFNLFFVKTWEDQMLEILQIPHAGMIDSEGPEYPEFVMHCLPKVFRDPQLSEYVRQILSRSVLLSKQKIT